MDTEIEKSEELSLKGTSADRIEQIKSIFNNPEFHKFVPGYVEYQENLVKVKEPYLHGTGSYALRRILVEGLSTNKKSARLSGEESSINQNSDTQFISLADSNSRGESIARAYAYSTSSANSVGFNSDIYFDESRIERLLKEYAGIDNFVEHQISLFVNYENISLIEEYRTVFRQEAQFLLEYGLGYGNYVFSIERALNDIKDLSRIRRITPEEFDDLDGLELLEIRKTLFKANILRNKLDREILIELGYLVGDREKSWLGRKIGKVTRTMKQSIIDYESRGADETDELENQFPVVLLVEGRGIQFEDDKLAIIEEKRTRDTINPDQINEIRVPEEKASIVEEWVNQKGLEIKVTPLEYYEVNEIVLSTQSH